MKENPKGVSLAQLPLLIKRKINFELNLFNLGFNKLKDLLTTIDNVQIEIRQQNHPFARLTNGSNQSKSLYGSEKGSQAA